MEQLEVLEFAVRTLESQHIPYMVVGSLASMAYGEVRMTRDIDIVIELALEQIPAFCEAFRIDPDFYLHEPAIVTAARQRTPFNVIHTSSGNKLDFMFPRSDAYGREEFSRRQRAFITANLEGCIACPENVILGKLWYYSLGESEKHLRDIAGMLKASGDVIDQAYIEHWAGEIGVLESWKLLQARLDARS
jgi:hypothetical protein